MHVCYTVCIYLGCTGTNRRLNLLPNFQKGEGLTGSQILKACSWERGGEIFRGGGAVVFTQKTKLISELKYLSTVMFFSVITKNLNWEILTNNLVTFTKWDGVKDEKLY